MGERQATSSPRFWYRTSKQITFGFNNIMNLKCNCLNNKRFNLPDVGVIPPKVDKYYWPPIFIGGICTTTEPQPETGWIKYYSAKPLLTFYARNIEKDYITWCKLDFNPYRVVVKHISTTPRLLRGSLTFNSFGVYTSIFLFYES